MRLNDINGLFGQAVQHHIAGRLFDALALYETVLRSAPGMAPAHCNRAIVLQSLNRLDDALNGYDRAIELQPDYADALYNKAIALKRLDRTLEAVRCYDRAIALKPDHVQALINRGNALRELGRPAEALSDFDRGIALLPRSADAHFSRANALVDMKRLQEALHSFDAALALSPNHVEAHYNKGTCTLLSGDWEAGWPLYEWRKTWAASAGLHVYPEPEWTGREGLGGKTLLIHAEQGLGDTIQFCRYALLARERGANVVLAVQEPLVRLLKSLGEGIRIEKLPAPPVSFDQHISLLSMPLALGTTVGSCPAGVPYLRAEPDRVAKWKKRIGDGGIKIGICWQGRKHNIVDQGRSFALRYFEQLSQLPNVRVISLQKNDGVEQLRDLPPGMRIETLGNDFDADCDAFIDTAAVIECLDLVITSDTAVAHLAGALAKPAWVALKFVPEWRWLLDRAGSPWYPTLRLFRQPSPGDWQSVFAAIQTQLVEEYAVGQQKPSASIDIDALFGQAVDHHIGGRLHDALSCYDAVLRLNPAVAPAHANRALALQTLGRLDEALEGYKQAVALKPDYADAYYNMGNALKQLGRFEGAALSYDAAIRVEPDHVEAYCNRGNALLALKRPEEALKDFDKAIALKPQLADAHYNKGKALQDLGQPAMALASYGMALTLNPVFAEAYYNRGNALQELRSFDAAIRDYDQAIALKPEFSGAHDNRANALKELGRFKEALHGYDRAIACDPENPEAHFDKGVCALSMGRFEEGWQDYEWRKKRPGSEVYRCFPESSWTGREDLHGKTLFIEAEQGLGDTIQFCRYAVMARHEGARVILAAQNSLVRLLGGLDPAISVETLATTPAQFDYHVALMSMPLAFRTTLDACPSKVPYLRAEPARVAGWKRKIGEEGFKIGICWQGSTRKIDIGRSFALRHFRSIGELPGVRLISLQKNEGVEQLADLPSGMSVEALGENFDAGSDAFLDTAAVMECLDLVITSDTAVAHLAGALARPTWVALKHIPDWRWLLHRADSPWYPTMRLFRQPGPGDWASVFAEIEAHLAPRLAGPARNEHAERGLTDARQR